MMHRWPLLLAAAGFLVGGVTSASATMVTPTVFNFTSCHIAAGCGSASSFGTVTMTQVDADMDGTQDDVHFVVSGPAFTFFAETGAIKPTMSAIFAFNGSGGAANIVNESPATTTGVTGSFSVNGQPDFGTFDSAKWRHV